MAALIRSEPSPFVPVCYSLASAYQSARRKNEAFRAFQTISESPRARIEWPIPYIRSFHRLGGIYEEIGDLVQARRCFKRFLDFWTGGSLDREHITQAAGKVSI